MRIRQIKPEWWGDKALQTRLTAECREFYIGLWHNADDAGWLRWNPDEIAAALYSFKSMKVRERLVRQWAEALMELDTERPHLIIERCGRHARVPKMPVHQVVAQSRRWTKYGQEHTTQCLLNDKAMPSPEGKVGNGTGKEMERGGTGGIDNDAPPFDPLEAALGPDRMERVRQRATKITPLFKESAS